MTYSVIDYLDIISYAIKNKKTLELVSLKWRTITERSKRKRRQEYVKRAIGLKKALVKVFPGKDIDFGVLSELENHMIQFKKNMGGKDYPSINNPYPIDFGLDQSFCRFLFSLCKFREPEIVVETGVANGFSSSYILFSMNLVKKGKLISIDNLIMPWHTKDKIGQAIPDWLKSRQELIVGDAALELKKFLNSNRQIDIFIHDSEHTYENMIKEFRVAWSCITDNGFLLSDDVFRNDAFLDFADEVKVIPTIIQGEENKTYFGIIQK